MNSVQVKRSHALALFRQEDQRAEHDILSVLETIHNTFEKECDIDFKIILYSGVIPNLVATLKNRSFKTVDKTIECINSLQTRSKFVDLFFAVGILSELVTLIDRVRTDVSQVHIALSASRLLLQMVQLLRPSQLCYKAFFDYITILSRFVEPILEGIESDSKSLLTSSQSFSSYGILQKFILTEASTAALRTLEEFCLLTPTEEVPYLVGPKVLAKLRDRLATLILSPVIFATRKSKAAYMDGLTGISTNPDPGQRPDGTSLLHYRVNLTDILYVIAASGYVSEVLPACCVCRFTWWDKELWSILIKHKYNIAPRNPQARYVTRLMLICRHESCTLQQVERLLYLGVEKGIEPPVDALSPWHMKAWQLQQQQLQLQQRTDEENFRLNPHHLHHQYMLQQYHEFLELQGQSGSIDPPPHSDVLGQANGAMHIDVFFEKLIARSKEAYVSCPLIAACEHGDIDHLMVLLTAGADVNTFIADTTFLRKSLLRPLSLVAIASRHGHTDCVRYLLAAGAPAETPVQGSTAPITAATLAGHIDCVQLLLDAGVAPGDAALWACDVGDAEILKLLLPATAFTPDIAARGLSKRSCIDKAATTSTKNRGGKIECVKLMIGVGAPLESAIKIALRIGNRECVELLIAGGANVGEALLIACRGLNAEYISLLAAAADARNFLDSAFHACFSSAMYVSTSAVKCLEILIRAGADVNALNSLGRSPLYRALVMENVEVITLLLETGANMTIDDKAAVLKLAQKTGKKAGALTNFLFKTDE